jgi:hypothetical protein
MSKILITGNGFDLFHQLPTKYGHFMAIMMTIEETSFSDNITFEELFGSFFNQKFENDYNLIIQNYDIEKINFFKSDLEEINDILKKNHWFNHFKSVLNLSTWIDFEMEIERILSELSMLFEASRLSKTNTKNFRFSNEAFNENFIAFGISEIKTNDVLTIKDDFIVFRTGKINEAKILKFLVESLKQFTQIFNKYLVLIVERFLDQKEFKYSGVNFYLMDKIYTFNYTDVFEKLYGINKDKIVYLHGKMNKIDSSQNLIFGISDIPESLKNNKVFDFTKYYQKIRKNNNCKFIELPLKSKNNLKETIFYIIGHSLDESDAKYIIDLFKYLELDSNKYSKICVFYFDDNDFDSKLNNLIKIIGEEIVVEMNKGGRLYFEELTSDNLKKQFSVVLKESKKIGIY